MKHFHKDLAKGKAGEAAFAKLCPKLSRTDGRAGDFSTPDGVVVELKTDSYSMQATANFFIERYSSVDVGSPGGPWQAAAHGCKYFVYFYSTEGVAFVFDVQELIGQLEPLLGTLKPVEIRNHRWTTVGFKVPREWLRPLTIIRTSEDAKAFGW